MRAVEKKYKVVRREEKVASEGFPEKRTFEYRPEGSEGGAMGYLREEQLCSGNSKHKG